jgi:hypothetical protein
VKAKRLVQKNEQASKTALQELRDTLRRGIEQADRGELFDGDVVFAEIRALSAPSGRTQRVIPPDWPRACPAKIRRRPRAFLWTVIQSSLAATKFPRHVSRFLTVAAQNAATLIRARE